MSFDQEQNTAFAGAGVNNIPDADTMFEHWVMTNDIRIRNDFAQFYPTDPRNEYIAFWNEKNAYGSRTIHSPLEADLNRLELLINQFFANERFGRYYNGEMEIVTKAREAQSKNQPLLPIVIAILGFTAIMILQFLF